MSPIMPDSTTQKIFSAEEIQVWLTYRLAEQLGVEPDKIDIREPLESYGLDSAQAMLVMSQAETLLGFQLSPLLLWHYPTIELLSQRIAEESEEGSKSEVFEI